MTNLNGMTKPRWTSANAPLLVLFLTFGVYFALLVPKLIWLDDSGLWVGHEHLWSDWPLHISMLRRFSDCPPSEWLTSHPMIGGEPLHYPFVAAFLSGVLVRLGLSVPLAIQLPTLYFLLLLLFGMYRLWEKLLAHRWLPLVPIALFFLAAGPGALIWLDDVLKIGKEAVFAPPHEYSRVDDYGWYAGNFVVGMLLPQRAFLPGMTLTVWLLFGLLKEEKKPRDYLFLTLGAGLLPIVHMHSLIALFVLGGALVIATNQTDWRRWREFLVYFLLPASLLAAGCYFAFLRPSIAYPKFIGWQVGFQAKTLYDWPFMWWRFWGLFPIVAAAGFFVRKSRTLLGMLSGSALLFVLANLIRFQPIAWDNSKVFLWAYFGLSGAVTLLLKKLVQRGWSGTVIATILFFSLTLTGVVELTALWRTDLNKAQVLAPDDLELGEAIRKHTRPDAVFLTSMDITNAPMSWGGRTIYLGFGGWMPNFGFDHQTREANIKIIYAGGPAAAELLKNSPISHVLIGPGERHNFQPNEAWFTANYAVAFEIGDKKVFAVK
jgi:hypothetical protein